MDSVAHFTSDHFSIDEIEIKKLEFLNSDDSFGWMSETKDDLEGKRKCTIFSDSVFCTIDLSNDPDKSKTIFKELVRLYEISDLLIQRKILFRGGITIDNVFHATNTIFGPGIISAYELESNHAIFPRLCIDSGVIDILEADPDLADEISIYSEDFDGMYFLNYLKYNLYHWFRYRENHTEINFVNEDSFDLFYKLHRDYVTERMKGMDPKIKNKILWLKNYHNRTLRSEANKLIKYQIDINEYLISD